MYSRCAILQLKFTDTPTLENIMNSTPKFKVVWKNTEPSGTVLYTLEQDCGIGTLVVHVTVEAGEVIDGPFKCPAKNIHIAKEAGIL